jgi:hypothetical protein
MSSLAFPRRAAPRRAGVPASWRDVLSRRGVDVLLAVALTILAAGLLAFLPSAFSVDSWLALVTGREVWQTGLPHHEVLTSMSHGIAWIDQQWLSQLATYGLFLLGGIGLVGVANMTLFVLGVAAAVVGARRLGAPPRAVLLVLPFCLWLVIPSHEVRTQEFAMPLFAATAYLLARDSRSPSPRVYWCLPILVLWANLHGSVTLGALLVVLRGATLAWERRSLLLTSLRPWRRPLALVAGAPLCLLATPYGLSIISYYHTMFLGSTVMKAVTEWQPITSVAILAVPFFIIAAVAVWSVGRHPSRMTMWEQLALLLLAAGSIEVIRNLLFFGLFALMVLPVALGAGARAERNGQSSVRGRVAINGVLCGLALAAVLVTGAAALVRPASAVELSYQRTRLLTVVERATRADPSLKLFTDVRFADWLLWRDPALSGRIANDARWELLTPVQMNELQAVFNVVGTNWKQGARGYRLLVLDSKYDPEAAQAFSTEPGNRILYDDGERLVILRSAREAG